MAESIIQMLPFDAIIKHWAVNSSTPRSLPIGSGDSYLIIVGRGSNGAGGLYFLDGKNDSVSPIVEDTALTLSATTTTLSITSTTSGYRYLSIYRI